MYSLVTPLMLRSVCFVVLACAVSWPCNAGLREQIAESEDATRYSEPLTESGVQVLEKLCATSDELGRMPSLTEFKNLMAEPDVEISPEDYDAIYKTFRYAQQPPVSQKDLYKTIKMYREAISSGWIAYDVTVLNEGDLRESSWLFGMDGDKLYCSKTKGTATRTESFDGTVLRGLDIEAGENHEKVGSILELDYRERFIDVSNPLRLALLLDTKRDLGIERLEEELSHIAINRRMWQTPEEFRGFHCVVMGTPKRTFYLAPELGYAIVGYRYGSFEYDKSLQRGVHKRAGFRRDYDDFAEVHNGIHIAKHIDEEVYRNGSVAVTRTTSVRNIAINEPRPSFVESLPEDPFDIIPDKAIVHDLIRNANYRKGVNETVESVLRSSSGLPNRTILLVANIVALFVLVVVVLVRRRKAA